LLQSHKEVTSLASQYFESVGRRKAATARVRIYPGEEGVVVNSKPAYEYFTRPDDNRSIQAPFQVTGTVGQYGVSVLVRGGGITGQAEAIRHGIARALLKTNPEYRGALKSAGLLTRDPRVKERKKPGLKRARKAPQYTKR
jgi:small subunit ribosomal protein S9